MDENKISGVKALLYNVDNDEVKRTIFQTQDQEVLYVYAYNYNWDNKRITCIYGGNKGGR